MSTSQGGLQIEELKVTEEQIRAERKQARVDRAYRYATSRGKNKFVRGPIPLTWLIAAGALSPAAFRLGIELWFIHGLTRGARTPTVNLSYSRLGLAPRTARRALAQLEAAGLVSLVRKPGRLVQFKLLDAVEQGVVQEQADAEG